MPYIGSAVSKSTDIKRITFATSTTGSGPFALGWTPASENTLRVTINGVVQQDSSITLSGANLTLVGVALVSGDELEVQGIVNVGAMDNIPMDGSVTEGKIGGGAVTAAKIGSGAVTSAKIGADAVTAAAMADDSIGIAELSATGTAEAGTYLQGNNTWGAIAASGFLSISTPATGTASWVKPTGVTKIIVEVQAGGGGGSSGNGTAWGGNGGSGAYAKKFIDVSSIVNADIVVGSAGAGGDPSSGGTGGTSSFTCTGHTISCTGGLPGQYGVGHGDGGLGGTATASGAFMLVNGQNGGQSYSYGDQGGDSVLGLGGMNPNYDGIGSSATYPATGYGAGGAGGHGAHASYHGGAASVGIVIVWEYK